VVVFSPRHPGQVEELWRRAWRNDPVVLREAVPFVSLLKGVDAVVTSGGTMAREAGYLGVPSYSVFQGEPGGVDLYLQRLGRMRLISDPNELDSIRPLRLEARRVLESNPGLLGELVRRFGEIAGRHRAL
jgi:predicted glycosyltransferase